MPKLIDQEEDVELGEEVEVRRRPSSGSLIAVRVGRDLLTRINEYGSARSKTVSQVMREGAEALISGQIVVNYVSINSPNSPVIEGRGIVILGSSSSGGRSIAEHPTNAKVAASSW